MVKLKAMDNIPNVCEATSQSHDLDLDNCRPTHRKGKKLLAEKKRRARINNCLMQIRDLVCDGEEEKDTDLDKMEKAEILEKTLEVLTRLRHEYSDSHRSSTIATRKAMAVRYASGFSSCAEESIRYIQSSRLVPAEVKVQLQNHLRAIARRMEAVVQVESQGGNFAPPYAGMPSSSSLSSSLSSDRLPTGVMVGEEPNLSGFERVPTHGQRLSDMSEVRGYYIPSPIHSSTPVVPQQIVHSTGTPLTHQIDQEHSNYTPDTFTKHEHAEQPQASTERRMSDISNTESSTKSFGNQKLSSSSSGSSAFYKPETFSSESSGDQKLTPSFSTHSSYPLSMPSTSSVSSSIILHPTPLLPTPPFHPDQPVYSYHGYEPYPTTPSFLVQPVRYVTTPIGHSPALTTAVTKPPNTPSNALDLCVKRNEVHQISPETMWRPW